MPTTVPATPTFAPTTTPTPKAPASPTPTEQPADASDRSGLWAGEVDNPRVADFIPFLALRLMPGKNPDVDLWRFEGGVIDTLEGECVPERVEGGWELGDCTLRAELPEGSRISGMPFPDAYDLIVSSWIADRWGYDALNAIVELYRLYRPWEDKVHRKVYLEEVEAAIREHGDGRKDGHPTPLEGVPRRFLYGLRRPANKSEWSSEVTPGVKGNGRFEEMSEGARRVLSFAEEEAKSLNHHCIGTEHILMGLVRDTEGVGARILAGLGLELEGTHAQVAGYVPRGEVPIRGDIGLSSRAKKLLKSASKEATTWVSPAWAPSTC